MKWVRTCSKNCVQYFARKRLPWATRLIWSDAIKSVLERQQVTGRRKLHIGELYSKKVKFSLEQAMKAQRGSRGIGLLFL
jgi:hypothetical protein